MKKIGILLLLLYVTASAQTVQYASKLIKYSSDLGGKQFGIKRILGKPDVFPQGGFSANAWMPKNALDGREIVSVGFEKAQTVQQIAIFENLNAGCVVAVSVSTDGEKFQNVWSRRPNYQTVVYRKTLGADRAFYFGRKRRKIGEVPEIINPGIERVFLDHPVENVIAVKIEFNFALLPGAKQVDAIGISDSTQPLEAQVALLPLVQTITAQPQRMASNASIPCVQKGTYLYATNYENDREVIYGYPLENGKLGSPQPCPQFMGDFVFNYIEYASDDYVLKGGLPYQSGTQETGYALYRREANQWINEGPIKIAAYSNFDAFSDATMSPDAAVLILAVESDFTQGGTDLYVAKRKPDGSYGMLQSLGKIINSAGDESAPQLLSDQKTLLFASNGFSGYGSHDIYVSYRLDDTWKNWSEPLNLGPIVNSLAYEVQPFYDEINERLWYTTSTEEGVHLVAIAIPKTVLLNR